MKPLSKDPSAEHKPTVKAQAESVNTFNWYLESLGVLSSYGLSENDRTRLFNHIAAIGCIVDSLEIKEIEEIK